MFRPRCASTRGVRCPPWCDVQSRHMFSGWDATAACHHFHAEVYFHVSAATKLPMPPRRSLSPPARTSRCRLPLSNYTGGNFCSEDNINISLLKYWDVKFCRGLLTASGNDDGFRLPGKSDSLSPFQPWLLQVFGATEGPLAPPLSAAPQRGSVPQSSLAAAIDGEASLPWQLTFTGSVSLACRRCWIGCKQTDDQTAGNVPEEDESDDGLELVFKRWTSRDEKVNDCLLH